jgi:hypothetical protein
MLELTEEEKANGWTSETLEKYLKDREKAQSGIILFDTRQKARPRFANNLYRPLRWR